MIKKNKPKRSSIIILGLIIFISVCFIFIWFIANSKISCEYGWTNGKGNSCCIDENHNQICDLDEYFILSKIEKQLSDSNEKVACLNNTITTFNEELETCKIYLSSNQSELEKELYEECILRVQNYLENKQKSCLRN